MKTKIMVLIY